MCHEVVPPTARNHTYVARSLTVVGIDMAHSIIYDLTLPHERAEPPLPRGPGRSVVLRMSRAMVPCRLDGTMSIGSACDTSNSLRSAQWNH